MHYLMTMLLTHRLLVAPHVIPELPMHYLMTMLLAPLPERVAIPVFKERINQLFSQHPQRYKIMSYLRKSATFVANAAPLIATYYSLNAILYVMLLIPITQRFRS